MDHDFWGWVYWTGHTISPAAIIGSALGWFPGIAAAVALVFYLLQIYESATVQSWLHNRRLRKIALYKIRMATLEAEELKAVARKHEKEELLGRH